MTSPVNPQYFESLHKRIDAATSCADLKNITNNATTSVNAAIASANSAIASVQTQVSDLAAEIADLTGHIGVLAAAQSTKTALGTVAATAPQATTLAGVITYIQAHGAAQVQESTAGVAAFAKQALALGKSLQKIQHRYERITSQLASIEAQISELPARLATVTTRAAAAATKFPSCSL